MTDCDCIIVGMGPVGALAGNLLVRYGVRVLVVEKEVSMYSAPRAVAMDDETLRLFGMVDADLARWMDGHLYPATLATRSGPPPEARAPSQGWVTVGPMPPRVLETTGYAEFGMLHQPSLERRLRQQLADHPLATIRIGAEARRIEQTDYIAPAAAKAGSEGKLAVGGTGADKTGGTGGTADGTARGSGVSVTVRDCATGEEVECRARYLLAADGGSSRIRKQLGIPYVGATSEPWVVIDIETDDADIAAAWTCIGWLWVWDPTIKRARSLVHVPIPGPRCGRRFEITLERDDVPDEMTKEPKLRHLLNLLGVSYDKVTLVRAVVYTFHTRHATAWSAGSIFLIGDSAHCMPPFRGQGMCSGLRDAANLSWKIALSLQLEKGLGHLPISEAYVSGNSLETPNTDTTPLDRPHAPAKAAAAAAATATPATPARPGVQLSAVGQLLSSYQPERLPQLLATSAIAASLGELVSMRHPAMLRGIRDRVARVLFLMPWTRTVFLTLPPAVAVGLFDFHDTCGQRAHSGDGASGGSGGAGVVTPLDGWMKRDAAAGCLIPNHFVELINTGSAVRMRLDELLTPSRPDGDVAGNTGIAPLWHVLVSQRFSSRLLAPPDGGKLGGRQLAAPSHPLTVLRRLRDEAETQTHVAHGCPQSILSYFVGVQLLPVSGSPARIARHAAASSAAAAAGSATPAVFAVPSASAHVSIPAPSQGKLAPSLSCGSSTADEALDASGVKARRAYINAVYRPVLQAYSSPDAVRDCGGELYVNPVTKAESWGALADVAAADTTHKLELWLTDHDADVAIVRPDRLVYGLYKAEELEGALTHLRDAFSVGSDGSSGSQQVADSSRSTAAAAATASSTAGGRVPVDIKLRSRPNYLVARVRQLMRTYWWRQ